MGKGGCVMLSKQKHRLFERQKRAHITGFIEIGEDQEILFYDDEHEEVTILHFKKDEKVEILLEDSWYHGIYSGNGQLSVPTGMHKLRENDTLRIPKKVQYALDYMLKEATDDSFVSFTSKLNELSFSIHDCIYSYNQMVFLEEAEEKKGVSFYQFDNEEAVCAVQHHFLRGNKHEDRFEFTVCTGTRALLTQLKP